jgi:HJR/Mrr/RecB family endonuclease
MKNPKNDKQRYNRDLFGNEIPAIPVQLPLALSFEPPTINKPVIFFAPTPRYIVEHLKKLPWQKQIQELSTMHHQVFEDIHIPLLEDMGLRVAKVTKRSNEADGGMDIICCPINCPIPLLTVISIKHRSSAKISRNHINEVQGLITQTPNISAGWIITNTGYDPSAKHAAETSSVMLQLKGLSDTLRWIRGDYSKEYEWSDLPEMIKLGQYEIDKRQFVPIALKLKSA